LGLDPTYNLGNIGDLGNSRSVHPQHASVDHKHKLSPEKKAWTNLIQAKKQQERDLNCNKLLIEIELNYHGGFFRSGFISPFHHGSGHSLYQHGVSTQDFYVLHSAIGRYQQFNACAPGDVVSFGQLRVDRLYTGLQLARAGLRQGRMIWNDRK
jgi:hypothetical protein